MEIPVLPRATSFQDSWPSWKEETVQTCHWAVLGGCTSYRQSQVLAARHWDLQPLADTEHCRWLLLSVLEWSWVGLSCWGQHPPEQISSLACNHLRPFMVPTHMFWLTEWTPMLWPSSDLNNYGLSWNFSMGLWNQFGVLRKGLFIVNMWDPISWLFMNTSPPWTTTGFLSQEKAMTWRR